MSRTTPLLLLAMLPALACKGDPGPGLDTDGTTSGSSTGSTSTTLDDPSLGDSTGSSSESSSTTGPMPCVSDMECTDEAAPFCGTNGECGTCTDAPVPDAACAGFDKMLPLCVGDACVACTDGNPIVCEDQLLLCDDATNTCVPCSEHGECPSGACELSVGRCFPEDFVVRVDGDEVAMPPELYDTVGAAVAAVPAGMHGVIVVHELNGAAPYTESVLIDADKTIALLAAAGEEPIIQGTGGNPGLRVEGAATILYMDGLRVAGNTTGRGVEVNQALAWLDRSHIVQNSGGGILAENNAELVLRNCFVGGPAQDVDAIALDASTLDMLYTTAGGGGVISSQARALFCANAATASVRNSILVSLDTMSEVVCPGVTLTTSATEAEVGFMAAWFMGYATGDFSLSATGATTFADIAQWVTTDPPTDIDGDPRPTVDGTADYAGADVPQ